MPTSGIRLFQVFGITVYLHWTWFVIAAFQITRPLGYAENAFFWGAAEYIGLFGLVLLHEFGHSLACRSTGGKADTIVLWPLGGAAYVDPPERAGAMLWSIAAGPLVNVVLAPILIAAFYFSGGYHAYADPNVIMTSPQRLLMFLAYANVFLLIFNMLPVYPLDGGQIVRSLLWFFIGQWRSLRIAAGLGALCCMAGMGYFIGKQDIWLVVICGFGLFISYNSFQVAGQMLQNHNGR